jgi:cell division septation protein DedD
MPATNALKKVGVHTCLLVVITKMKIRISIATLLLSAVAGSAAPETTPQYQIYDIGVVEVGDTASQGFGVSNAGIAVGRSIRSSGSQAFTWTLNGGIVGLPNLSGRNHAVANSAAPQIVVGTAATTLFGSSRLPIMWLNGAVSQLPLPPGETLGDANSVNSSGVAVGSVDGGSNQRGAIYTGGGGGIITQTTATGCFFVTAFGINDFGRVVGQGIDPNNAARNVGIVYDIGQNMAFEVGALPGFNGALAFAVSNTGYVVGSSMLNQGSGLPFIWSDEGGIVAIPLATGTSQGSARAVNSAGWVVGNDSSAFSIPFLYDGASTYRLADLIPPNSGWDLSMNTSSSALGISEDGVIVGTGVHNGETHAYAMVPMSPTPTPTPSLTSSPTATATVTATPTPTPTSTSTPTPTPTATPRPTPTPRSEPTPRPRPTPVPRP